jgi:hypothetical protein
MGSRSRRISKVQSEALEAFNSYMLGTMEALRATRKYKEGGRIISLKDRREKRAA